MTMPPAEPCPYCGHEVRPGYKCWGCERDDPLGEAQACTTDPSPAVRDRLPDTRSEKEIEAAIMATLQMFGFTVYKTSQPQKPVGMSPGIPDLYVAGHGVTAWLEVKRPTGTQSEAQAAFERTVTEHGALYRIVRSEAEAVQWAQDARNPNTRRTA